jgi:hypothetical protein
VGKVINAVVKFADSLQPQSPFKDALPFPGKEHETAGAHEWDSKTLQEKRED